MDSAYSSLSKEQFLCSICLDVFTEPVSTPCGHNYCRECIKKYWSYSNVIKCPLCEEMFHRTPDLQVNREFRDMLEVFKRTFLSCDDSSLAGPGDVPCNLCHERKCKALKSCLVCLASYCNVHLEPHRTVEAFKWHSLINPVLTLRERICKEHNKVAVMFCKDDQCCICSACLRDDHAMHNTVSLDEELQERKTQVMQMKSQVQNVLRKKRSMADRVQKSVLQGQQEVQNIQAEIIKACDEVVALVETKKVKLVRLLKEKQKAAEQEAKELLGQLQLQIIENVQMTATLEELSKTEDDFSLLRGLPPVASSVNTKLHFSPRVQPLLNLEMVRNVVATVKETVDGEMDNIVREVDLLDKEETFEKAMPAPTEKVFNDQLENLQKNYSVNVTLDPNTAHPSLIISADRKKVWDRGRKRKALDNPARFDFLHFVLGKEGFSSGWFYFEVALKGQNSWEVGVVRESINKKGFDLQLSPESGCWTLGSYWGRCQANANPPVILSCENPDKVGVFVDYEGGLVSFYSVATRALMYSFTECAFTASIPRNRGLSKCSVYTGTPAKTRIFPLFRPSGDGIDPLQIATVQCKKRCKKRCNKR